MREKDMYTNTCMQGETIGRNWPGYLRQIFTPKSTPSLIVPQSSHCRSIERFPWTIVPIEVGQRRAFPAVLVSVFFICFEITFNLVYTILLARSNARGSTRWVACCDVRQSTLAQQTRISSLFYLPTYASALSSIPRCGIKRRRQ